MTAKFQGKYIRKRGESAEADGNNIRDSGKLEPKTTSRDPKKRA